VTKPHGLKFGLRSAFRAWAAEAGFERDMAEMALTPAPMLRRWQGTATGRIRRNGHTATATL